MIQIKFNKTHKTNHDNPSISIQIPYHPITNPSLRHLIFLCMHSTDPRAPDTSQHHLNNKTNARYTKPHHVTLPHIKHALHEDEDENERDYVKIWEWDEQSLNYDCSWMWVITLFFFFCELRITLKCYSRVMKLFCFVGIRWRLLLLNDFHYWSYFRDLHSIVIFSLLLIY